MTETNRFDLSDNFGEAVPKPYGIGLKSMVQERVVGEDLFRVYDPQAKRAWVASDTTVEVQN